MTILSDGTIFQYVKRGVLVIEPFEFERLQPASYDVQLGPEVKSDTGNVLRIAEDWQDRPDFLLRPGQFVLGHTIETVKIPPDLVARIEGKSSTGRRGLIIQIAGFIDPGFEGQLTLEMHNIASKSIPLVPGMLIGQLSFHMLDQPAQRPYGPERGSHYQWQRGAVPSRSWA